VTSSRGHGHRRRGVPAQGSIRSSCQSDFLWNSQFH